MTSLTMSSGNINSKTNKGCKHLSVFKEYLWSWKVTMKVKITLHYGTIAHTNTNMNEIHHQVGPCHSQHL